MDLSFSVGRLLEALIIGKIHKYGTNVQTGQIKIYPSQKRNSRNRRLDSLLNKILLSCFERMSDGPE